MNIAFTKGLADDPKRYIFNSYLRLMGARYLPFLSAQGRHPPQPPCSARTASGSAAAPTSVVRTRGR